MKKSKLRQAALLYYCACFALSFLWSVNATINEIKDNAAEVELVQKPAKIRQLTQK